jgi:hypothetical protein
MQNKYVTYFLAKGQQCGCLMNGKIGGVFFEVFLFMLWFANMFCWV